MPEYRCKNCGAIFFGWGPGKVCRECSGELEPVNESAKRKRISEEEEGKVK
jgi:rRNA maturation endonuclease Nob1